MQFQIFQVRNFWINLTYELKILTPQCLTQYSFAEDGDELDIVVHWNHQTVWGAIISDILDSDHLQIVLHIMDHFKAKNIFEPHEEFAN
jgi:hypothetical protein